MEKEKEQYSRRADSGQNRRTVEHKMCKEDTVKSEEQMRRTGDETGKKAKQKRSTAHAELVTVKWSFVPRRTSLAFYHGLFLLALDVSWGCKMPIGMATDHWHGKRLGWEGCLGMKNNTIASLGGRG